MYFIDYIKDEEESQKCGSFFGFLKKRCDKVLKTMRPSMPKQDTIKVGLELSQA